MVDPAAFAAALRDDTALASVMLANNEIGTIAPVARARGAGARSRRRLPHRRGAGTGPPATRRRRAGRRPAVDLGPQVLRPEGGRRAVRPRRHAARARSSWAAARSSACVAGPRTSPASSASRPRSIWRWPSCRATVAAGPPAAGPARGRDPRGASGHAVVHGAGAPRLPNICNVAFPGVDGEALLVAPRPRGDRRLGRQRLRGRCDRAEPRRGRPRPAATRGATAPGSFASRSDARRRPSRSRVSSPACLEWLQTCVSSPRSWEQRDVMPG